MKKMNKAILTSAVLVAMASSTAMAADNDSEAFTLNATAANTCVLGAPSMSGPLTLVVADATTAFAAQGSVVSITFGDSYCNFPHELKLVSAERGMSYPSVADGGVPVIAGSDEFVQTVQYQAEVKGWSQNFMLDTNLSQAAGILPNGAFRNDAVVKPLLVKLTSLATTAPMLSGTYSDTLTVMLTPGI